MSFSKSCTERCGNGCKGWLELTERGERCGGIGVGGIGNGLAMPESGLTADVAVELVVSVLGETRNAAAMGGSADVVEVGDAPKS